MVELLTLPYLLPFSASFVVLLVLGVFELLLVAVVGFSPVSAAYESVEGDAWSDAFAFSDWLIVKKLPFVATVSIALACFTLGGYALQGVSAWARDGVYLHTVPSILGAMCLTILGLRLANLVTSKLNLDYVSTVVSKSSFLGVQALVLSPHLSHEEQGEVQVTDSHGNTHYFMVVAQQPGQTFSKNDLITLVAVTEFGFEATAR